MRLLVGRTAIITGAAPGLGYSIASALVDEGTRVVLGDIRGDQVRDAAERLGPSPTAIAREVDVTSADDIVALVAGAEEAFGSVDIMVNNAGLTRDATMRKMSEGSFDEVIDVHLKGSWLGTRAASDAMRRFRDSRINHQYVVDLGKGWQCRPNELQRRQGRNCWPDQGSGERSRLRRHPSQRDPAGNHRDGDDGCRAR
jgi:NAD(P)-dependent dehydrogenase (short-subunit alcohol dehydrogenase family)